MRSADRITAVLLLVFSAAFAAGALKYYRYWAHDGPGPAFLPFWLGVVMAVLAAMMLFRRIDRSALDWLPPPGEARNRVLVVLVRYLGRHAWWLTFTIALAAAAINWLVFVHWLRLPMPQGMFWTF